MVGRNVRVRKKVKTPKGCSGNDAIQTLTHNHRQSHLRMLASAKVLGAGRKRCTKRATLHTQMPNDRGVM